MGGPSHFVRQEVARLKQENEELRDEVSTLQRYVDAVQTLLETVDSLDPAAEVMSLLDRMLYNALTMVNGQEGSLLVVDEETNELVFVLTRGDRQHLLQGRRMPIDKGIAGWVALYQQPQIVNNPAADDRFYAGIDQAVQSRTQSILAVPILGGGRLLGVMELINKRDSRPFNSTDQALVVLLCRFAGHVLDQMLQQDQADDAGPAQNYEASPGAWG